VVGDTKYRDMRAPAPAAGYVPIMQDPQPKPSLSAVLRVDGPLAPVASAARSLAARIVPTIPAPALTTMDEVLNDAMSAERMLFCRRCERLGLSPWLRSGANSNVACNSHRAEIGRRVRRDDRMILHDTSRNNRST
jgi:hypothetical protein